MKSLKNQGPKIGDLGHPGWPRQEVCLVVTAVGVDHLVRVGDQSDTERKKQKILKLMPKDLLRH